MAGRIPRTFIDDLIARTDIVELIDRRVRLKKAGKNYQACCPFHNEKSPSFTVSQEKQFYHCFGCGAHGNAISFVMEYDNLEFVDAIEELASMYGMEVPREQGSGPSGPSVQEKRTQYELMESVARFYQYQLREHPNKQKVIDYLKHRGLSGEIAQKFMIGYAPDGWDAVKKRFGTDQASEQQLIDTGMLLEHEQSGRRYDRFRDRLMFPIRDKRGRVIAYGGRVLGDGTPKYLNSPETSIFHKGRELYGLYEVREIHKHAPRIVVVEGYMDVVALAQFGIDYAVASLGTSTTSEQLQALFRNTDEVICCYDGDRAGRDAAWRALENALPQLQDGKALKFVFLPDGEDPDSMVRDQGAAAFEQLLDQAKELPDFMFERLSQAIDMRQDSGVSKLASQAKPLIEKMPDGFYRGIVMKELANRLRWSEDKLSQFIAKAKTEKARPSQRQSSLTPERKAISHLLQHPDLCRELPLEELDVLKQLNTPGSLILYQLIEQIQTQGLSYTGQILEHWRGRPEEKGLVRLATWEHPPGVDNLEDEFLDILETLMTRVLEQRLNLLQSKANPSREEKREIAAILNELKL